MPRFLLAVLQTRTILNEPTAEEMEEALEKMPEGLSDAFEQTLLRISKQQDGRKNLGMNTLMVRTFRKVFHLRSV
jgi:hypothetical protein